MLSSELFSILPSDYSQLAEVYARVFAGYPWYEVSRCTTCCDFSSTLPDLKRSCNACESGFYADPAYPLDETAAYIGSELGKPDAVGRLVLSSRRILGFGWGYSSLSEQLAERKYKTDEMKEVVIRLVGRGVAFFYVSEVGVLPESQKSGWGRRLTEAVVDNRPIGLRRVVLRTNQDSGMRYIAEKLGMKPVVGLNTDIVDVENPNRVLFVGER